jgi:hypothetical protein
MGPHLWLIDEGPTTNEFSGRTLGERKDMKKIVPLSAITAVLLLGTAG